MSLKLRFADFQTITRSLTGEATQDGLEIFRRVFGLLERVARVKPVRLIGVSVSGLIQGESAQLSLFSAAAARRERVARAADRLARRFGDRALVPASLLEPPQRRWS